MTVSYNEFCDGMMRTLRNDMHKHQEWHAFHFAAQDDLWGHCCLGRIGVPLGHYAKRWADLPVLPTTLEDSPCNPDPKSRYNQDWKS